MSDNEQSHAFIRGIQPALWSRIQACLDLLNPRHHPDDPYTLAGIREAAELVLHGTASLPISIIPQSSVTTHVEPQSQSIKLEDINMMFNCFTTTLIQAINNRPSETTLKPSNSNPNQSPLRACTFCADPGHFMDNWHLSPSISLKGKSNATLITDSSSLLVRKFPDHFLVSVSAIRLMNGTLRILVRL